MHTILFLPLLSIPSGHHQVADTMIKSLEQKQYNCKKVELLGEWNSTLEKLISGTYLKWIQHSPKSYAWMYNKQAYHPKGNRSYKYYELLFLKKLMKIVEEEKPSLIVCTHGLPSYLLNKLKEKGQIYTPVINVYTDFFINNIWGKTEINYHFVPNTESKNLLQQTFKIPHEKIIVTGIPTDATLKTTLFQMTSEKRYNIIVSGGSIGLGNISEFLKDASSNCDYYVLCGTNEKLYQQLIALKNDYIKPLRYIKSREQINTLYDHGDAIITKPGGVTVNECLKKGVPIFVAKALPGQEDINLKYLTKHKLVHVLEEEIPFEEQIQSFLSDKDKISDYKVARSKYLEEIKIDNGNDIASFIEHQLMNPFHLLKADA